MYSFERGFVPTLHQQLLTSICGCLMIESECVTCKSIVSFQFDDVVDEKCCYPGFTGEYKERFVTHLGGESYFSINELVKSYSIGTAVNCFYYYPKFGFYNGLLDIFFLQDYWKIIHELGFDYLKSLYLSECKERAVLNFLSEKHCDFLLEESVFFSAMFQKHLSTVFSFRPLLSVIVVLLSANNGEVDCEITDYFLRKYHLNSKESICFDGEFFDNSFIEFGLILILFSLFMCGLLVVK